MSDAAHGSASRPEGTASFLICQICLDRMQAPFSTRCGHSFCHECLVQQLEYNSSCATCSASITREDIFPNFTCTVPSCHPLCITIYPPLVEAALKSGPPHDASMLGDETASLPFLRRRIDALLARKRFIEKEQRSVETRSILEFLSTARSQKQQMLDKIGSEIAMLDRDIARVKGRLEREHRESLGGASQSETAEPEVPVIAEEELCAPKRMRLASESQPVAEYPSSALQEAKALIQEHYSDLQESYFAGGFEDPLESFGAKISQLSRLTRIRQVSALKLGDIGGASNIVSSIEFDRDAQIFATAGVSKKIRFYEFRDSMNTFMELHCPVREISCKSKVSCISWNPYIKHYLASADYEGLVTVYDTSVGTPICYLEEHEKRSWTVDFCPADPTRLASGSDDCYVKLWSTKIKKSICTIDGKANICSVSFHPEQGHLLAFGSADHHIHLYDLRYSNKPLDVMKGHKKAVSYVRFADNSTIVSASTDCTLRSWTLPGPDAQSLLPSATAQPNRVFSGHVNEKNFVGLGVQGDLLACGSENNSVFVYHRDLSKPLASFRFSSTCPLTDSSLESDVQQFVSSLCWKPNTNMLVAANSQGNIRILEIV